ncbi:MAG: sugar transferase [Clostridia bacterium]|nr:sugar transferase [Clostridia bacterium]
MNKNASELIVAKKSMAYYIVKRAFDFLSSLLLGIAILLPLVIIAVVIICKDFGNPFYKHRRVGKNGRMISVYKFRSMKKGADNLEEMLTPEQLEQYRTEYKLDDDPRLIGYRKPGDGDKCFGAKLRSTSLDELPQIIANICILGNMSVVGPRPILKDELESQYSPEEQKLFLSVKPGLTGYWQAYARNEVGYLDHGRQEMELYYVKHQSIWLDIKILFKTVEAVFHRRGAK